MDTDQTHLRDVSFSSYLSMVGENFPVDQPPIPSPLPARALQTPRRAKTSEELGVFEAERYYKMGVVGYEYDEEEEEDKDSSRNKLGYDQVMIQTPTNRRNKQHVYNKFRTPSVSSEGSSWNSHSALMMIKRKKGSSSLFSGMGCYGRSCSDKDSVIVRKPVRKSHDPKLTVLDGTKHPLPRVSIEVFGSKKEDQVMLNLERKLSMLTWDAVPKGQRQSVMKEEEIESDASSDLFEIDNISSQNGGLYEPSEASIEWSVVTASAADFSYDDKRLTETKKGGGGILGCKSYKAVRVVEPLPAPKSSYRPTLPLPPPPPAFTTHLTHNQSRLQ